MKPIVVIVIREGVPRQVVTSIRGLDAIVMDYDVEGIPREEQVLDPDMNPVDCRELLVVECQNSARRAGAILLRKKQGDRVLVDHALDAAVRHCSPYLTGRRTLELLDRIRVVGLSRGGSEIGLTQLMDILSGYAAPETFSVVKIRQELLSRKQKSAQEDSRKGSYTIEA